MVKYIILPLPLPANGRKTSLAENISAKDIYTWGSSLDIPPNKITINNQEKWGWKLVFWQVYARKYLII